MKMSITWMIEEPDPPIYDLRGNKLAIIHEKADDYDERIYRVPGVLAQAFIRARRDATQRFMSHHGFTKEEPIDWSFLEKGTKQ